MAIWGNMDKNYRVAVVDDTAMQRLAIKGLLAKKYDVVDFDSGESFLAAPFDFDVVLLDIDMPGIDGYEICRRIHLNTPDNDTPVIFVSGYTDPEARVAAYEAGGDDFLPKPVRSEELYHKTAAVLLHREELRQLASRSNQAQQVAFSAMAGLGDLGIVTEFLRKAGTATDYASLASLVNQALFGWGLSGYVQIRGCRGDVTVSSEKIVSPIQLSVMATMRNMGRIFEMKSRAVVNFEHVSILVNNMPTEDVERMGRLRDNLAWLGEGANVSVFNMDSLFSRQEQLADLGNKIAAITGLMQNVALQDCANRDKIQRITTEALEGFSLAVGSFNLTAIQSEYITSALHETEDILNLAFEEAATIQREFTDISVLLRELAEDEKARQATMQLMAAEQNASEPEISDSDDIVLF